MLVYPDKTCDVLLCCTFFVVFLFIVLPSLFSLFYRFLHKKMGWLLVFHCAQLNACALRQQWLKGYDAVATAKKKIKIEPTRQQPWTAVSPLFGFICMTQLEMTTSRFLFGSNRVWGLFLESPRKFSGPEKPFQKPRSL